MDRAYDFTPLDAPLSSTESAARRRAILAGRSLIADLSFVRTLLLVGVAIFAWPAVLIFSVVTVNFVIGWVARNGPTAEWGAGTPLLLGAVVVAVGLCVVVTRLLLIPPAWGRWVRMHRFAEVNGMTFIRRATQADLPDAPIVAPQAPGATLLSDVFSDPVAGIVLGNVGAGPGSQAFILMQPDGTGMAAIDALPFGGFTVRETPDGRVATRYRSVRMRDSVTVRRMFATADLVLAGEDDAIR
ncbi:hypothetical protein [Pseudolysinimonas sp.]|uniref:hypothetical protein n=1 Tax=Pseudolysinimonas sp. TaxID=2680009 RepID=UPI0037846963